VRFPTTWLGGTNLIAFSGSRTDNHGRRSGKRASGPTGTDFFRGDGRRGGNGQPGPRGSTLLSPMAREPDVHLLGASDGTESTCLPMSAG